LMWILMLQHGATILQDKMYIFGGNHNGRYLSDLQVCEAKCDCAACYIYASYFIVGLNMEAYEAANVVPLFVTKSSLTNCFYLYTLPRLKIHF
jgi:hypothetical protein